jgi:hypothetical protein
VDDAAPPMVCQQWQRDRRKRRRQPALLTTAAWQIGTTKRISGDENEWGFFTVVPRVAESLLRKTT